MVKTQAFGISVLLCTKKAKVTALVLPEESNKITLVLSWGSKVFLQKCIILL